MTKFQFGHASKYTLKDLFYDQLLCRFVGIGGGRDAPPRPHRHTPDFITEGAISFNSLILLTLMETLTCLLLTKRISPLLKVCLNIIVVLKNNYKIQRLPFQRRKIFLTPKYGIVIICKSCR